MSYVAVKGGTEAIAASKSSTTGAPCREARWRIRGQGARVCLRPGNGRRCALQRKARFRGAERGGDMLEAAFYLRAHRSTCQRIGESEQVDAAAMTLIRRISSAFKEIEGGQILGPSADYVVKLFTELGPSGKTYQKETAATPLRLPSALAPLRREDKVFHLPLNEEQPFDVTRSFPLPPIHGVRLCRSWHGANRGHARLCLYLHAGLWGCSSDHW